VKHPVGKSTLAGPGTEWSRRFVAGFMALLFLAPAALAYTAQEVGASTRSQTDQRTPAPGRSLSPAAPKLPGVTVEAMRRHALRLKVDQFVASVVVQPSLRIGFRSFITTVYPGQLAPGGAPSGEMRMGVQVLSTRAMRLRYPPRPSGLHTERRP